MTIKIYRSLLILCLSMIYLPATYAGSHKGLQIAQDADNKDSGWGFQSSRIEMILRNRAGKESRRKIGTKQMEVDNDGDKTLSLFYEPRDVRGTAMLTFSHGIDPDDQWLYLPAVKRVKRISSRNKSGPFMGSEFAFEDLSSQELDKYTYRYIGEEQCQHFNCFIIERIPTYKNSGYTRQLVWIDKLELRSMKIEFYDRKNQLLKTLESYGFQKYAGKYWRPDRMEMINHQTGKSTTLMWYDYDFNTPLKNSDFNKNALKKLL